MSSESARVVHLTRDYPPRSNGGLSSAVAAMVEAQVRAGLRCMVVSFDDYRPLSKKGEHGGEHSGEHSEQSGEHSIAIVRVLDPSALAEATARVASFAPQLVHVHHDMLWDFAATLCQRHGLASVLTVHTLQSEQNRLRAIASTHSSQAQRRALGEASAIHAPSQAVATLLREGGMRAPERIHVIRLGVSSWPEATRAFAEDRFAGQPLLIFVGRFADMNGFAQFLEALPELFRAYPGLRARAAGGLPDNPRAERRWHKRWRKLAGDVSERLDFAGWLSRDELSSLYRRATVLLVPSWFETFAQVPLEGMLHGTPLVCTRAGALAELVDEESAMLIEAHSAHAIVEGVTRTLDDPGSANQRRAHAFSIAHEGYDWDHRIGEIVALYQSLLRRA